MAKLLDVSLSGDIVEKTWVHNGDDNKPRITTQTIQDAEPVFKRAKHLSQNQGKDFRFAATIPGNIINDICYQCSTSWGISPRKVMKEIVQGKTDRAQKILKLLKHSRDYRKFQAKNY